MSSSKLEPGIWIFRSFAYEARPRVACLRIGISGWRYPWVVAQRLDVFVYFDNDANVYTPFDAMQRASE